MSSAVLVCENIQKRFKTGHETINVLDGLNFAVNKGEMVAIVGSSGSGKSTLLHILAGLDVADAGAVLINNQDLAKQSENSRAKLRNQELGFVFQFHHLLPEFSALENLLIPLRLGRKIKKEDIAYAEYLLEQVGLKDRMTHRPAELSGGERQRVAIARALVNKPSVVLMDEPTGNLDEDTAETILQLLTSLKQNFQASFVVVTHSREIAANLDRCYQLAHGKLNLMA